MGSNLDRYFGRIGARVKVIRGSLVARRWSRFNPGGAVSTDQDQRIALDILQDKHGEYFEIRTAPGSDQELVVQHTEPEIRHLLLLSRQFDERGRPAAKQKFLCGHDERHWFVAAIPESAPVSTVESAMKALKPAEVRQREEDLGVSTRKSFRRRNAAFIRQGEWFFVPATAMSVDRKRILRNEPLSRGNGSKAHWAEECYRSGGETVYVSPAYPTGLTAADFAALPERERKMGQFRTMVRDAAVYVRGEISHPDHATIELDGWYRVLMNTENQAKAMRFVAFLD